MPSNVIELVVTTVDRATPALNRVAATVGKLAIAGSLAFGAVLRSVVRNTVEAQKAAAQLDAAYKATGGTLGRTRRQLDELADSLQRTTTFSDDLTREAQSVLLTFDRVRGQAFERTVHAAADLSARMGTDLVSSVRQLGAALQDPARGLDRLRRAGIVFTEEQRKLIQRLAETGQVAKAQEAILAELERRVGGSATALRGTLGGALQALNNAWGDLLEQSEGATSGLVQAVNSLTDTLSDPATKRAVQDFFGLFVAGAEKALQAIIGLGSIFNLVGDPVERINRQLEFLRAHPEGGLSTGGPFSPFGEKAGVFVTPAEVQERIRELEQLQRQLLGLDPTRAQVIGRGGGSAVLARFTEDAAVMRAELEEFIPTVRRITEGPMAELQRELAEGTATAAEKARKAFEKFRTEAQEALAQGTISVDQFNERIREAEETILGLKPIEVTVKKIDETPFRQLTEAGRRAAEQIQDAFANATRSLLNLDKPRDILRRFLEAIREIPVQHIAEQIGSRVKTALTPTLGKLFGTVGGGGATTVQAATATVQAATAAVQTAAVQAQSATAAVQTAATQLTTPLVNAQVASVVINAQRCISNCATCDGGGGDGLGFSPADLLQFVPGLAGGTGHARGGLTWVGEAGRELVALPAGSRVMNQRQVAAAGGGVSIDFSPVTHIVIEGGDAEKNRAEFARFTAMNNAKLKKEMVEMLQDNGFGRLRAR